MSGRRAAKISAAVLLSLLPGIQQACAQGVITTIAGGGGVFRGNGGPATQATLGEIFGVTVDAAGNVFATDFDNNLVVKISPAGVLNVVAGNGIGGFSGDRGPSTSASLHGPADPAKDSTGNLYFADFYNNRVRKVSSKGTITTVAGAGYAPIGSSIGDGGSATSAYLGAPTGVALDSAGNLYIAEADSNRVRKVDRSGIIGTVAGTGVAGFSGDGGPAASAQLNYPRGIAVDGSGNVYVADSRNKRIRKISADGTISTVAGNGGGGFSGDGGGQPRAPLWGVPRGWQWIPPGTSISRTVTITAFAGSALTGSSPPSPATANRGFPATEAPPSAPL